MGDLLFTEVASRTVKIKEWTVAAAKNPLEWMDLPVEAYRDPGEDHGRRHLTPEDVSRRLTFRTATRTFPSHPVAEAALRQ